MATRRRPGRRPAADQRGRKRAPGRGPLIDRIWVPGPYGLRQIEGGARDAYDLTLTGDLLKGRYVWRVPVTVPVYEADIALLVELEEFGVHVTAENWAGPMKHTFGRNRLCMWYPDDPDDRKWRKEDGLLRLIDTAVMQLFKELYYRETGEWLGEEAPHDIPKIDPRNERTEAA